MSSDWTEVSLQEVTSKLGDGLHGTPNYDDNGEYFFINGNNLGSGRIVVDEKTKRVSATEYLKHKKDIGDRTILVSINGTIGNVALYYGEKVVLGKSACYFNVVDSVDKQYVRYVVTGEYFQNYIRTLATGSTIKNVSLKLMRDFRFQLPPIEIQRKISKTLEDLDNKIELNRQTNQTLEQIAQALFKSWFVDFEPTRAKIAAKEAGASAEEIERAAMCAINGKTPDQLAQLPPETQQNLKTTAALFPDALVDSELGEIPAGWSVGRIGDIAIAKGGYAFKSNAFIPTGNPVVKIKNIVGDGCVDLNDSDCIDELEAKKAARFKLNDGDLIMAMTGATVGKTGVVVTNGLSVYLNQRVAKFESELFGPKISWFLYCCFQRDVIFDLVVGAAHGSAQPNISSSGIESTQLILPGEKLIRLFCETTNSFFEKWMANISENFVTENLRNELLPKLLSGELSLLNVGSIDVSE